MYLLCLIPSVCYIGRQFDPSLTRSDLLLAPFPQAEGRQFETCFDPYMKSRPHAWRLVLLRFSSRVGVWCFFVFAVEVTVTVVTGRWAATSQ